MTDTRMYEDNYNVDGGRVGVSWQDVGDVAHLRIEVDGKNLAVRLGAGKYATWLLRRLANEIEECRRAITASEVEKPREEALRAGIEALVKEWESKRDFDLRNSDRNRINGFPEEARACSAAALARGTDITELRAALDLIGDRQSGDKPRGYSRELSKALWGSPIPAAEGGTAPCGHSWSVGRDTLPCVDCLTAEVQALWARVAEVERERDAALARLKQAEDLRQIAEALTVEMERTIAHFERPRGGMEVPFHGDFANAPPSVVSRFRWWVREMRSALSVWRGRCQIHANELPCTECAESRTVAVQPEPSPLVATGPVGKGFRP